MIIFNTVRNYFINFTANKILLKIQKQIKKQKNIMEVSDNLERTQKSLYEKIQAIKDHTELHLLNTVGFHKITEKQKHISVLTHEIELIQRKLTEDNLTLNNLRRSCEHKKNLKTTQYRKKRKKLFNAKKKLKKDAYQQEKLLDLKLKQYAKSIADLTLLLRESTVHLIQIKDEQIESFIDENINHLKHMENRYINLERQYINACSYEGTRKRFNQFLEQEKNEVLINSMKQSTFFKNYENVLNKQPNNSKINQITNKMLSIEKDYFKLNNTINDKITNEINWFDQTKNKSTTYSKMNKMLEILFSLTSFITLKKGYNEFMFDNKKITPTYYNKSFAQNIHFSHQILAHQAQVDHALLAEQEQIMKELNLAYNAKGAIKKQKFAA
tara:strand:- start:914 stop:2068 length:1155 start_codon:yes stop_codon:yes gene_type:complete